MHGVMSFDAGSGGGWASRLRAEDSFGAIAHGLPDKCRPVRVLNVNRQVQALTQRIGQIDTEKMIFSIHLTRFN